MDYQQLSTKERYLSEVARNCSENEIARQLADARHRPRRNRQTSDRLIGQSAPIERTPRNDADLHSRCRSRWINDIASLDLMQRPGARLPVPVQMTYGINRIPPVAAHEFDAHGFSAKAAFSRRHFMYVHVHVSSLISAPGRLRDRYFDARHGPAVASASGIEQSMRRLFREKKSPAPSSQPSPT
jgi:hypothetical protein